MNPTDTIIALEKALEAYEAATNGRDEARAIGALMFASNPGVLRTVLDAHASALRDAARYHWLRTRVSGVRDRHGIEEFDMPFVRPCIASIMKGSVAQHFDAAIDAQMAALDDNTKGAAPELADLGINGSRCGTHGTSGS